MAGLLDLIAEKGARMSISSPELIGPCSDMFDVIDPCFMFSVDAGSDMPSAEEETPDAA